MMIFAEMSDAALRRLWENSLDPERTLNDQTVWANGQSAWREMLRRARAAIGEKNDE